MAIILMQDWRRYGVKNDIANFEDSVTVRASYVGWTAGGSVTLTGAAGRTGDQVIDIGSTSAQILTMKMPINGTVWAASTVIISMMFKYVADATSKISSGSTPIIELQGASSQIQFKVHLDGGGTVLVESNAGAVVAVSPHAIQPGVWHNIEFKVSLADSGSFSMKVDNVLLINAASGDFKGDAGTATFVHLALSGNSDCWYDKILIADSSGSYNNDWLGDFRMEMALPTANGGTTGWTASAGSQYQCIDDAIGFSSGSSGSGYGADYISTSTLNAISQFTMGTISASNYSSILFCGLYHIARSDTTGDSIAGVCKSSATTGLGATMPLLGTTDAWYCWRRSYFDRDPNGSIAWTPTAINAAEFGVKKL